MKKNVFRFSTATAEDLSEVLLEEVVNNDSVVPELEMDAITKAIEDAIGGGIAQVESQTPKEAEVVGDDFIEKVAAGAVKRAKAKGMKLNDVTKKDKPATSEASLPKEKKPRAPRAPSVKLPATSSAGTPILRAARDKCSTCEEVVKWYATTDTSGAPTWECSVCGRVVPRRAR